MRVYEAKTFGDYLKKHLKTLPNGGRGVLRKISEATGIHPTSLSQAVKGERFFSLEQVEQISRFLGLTNTETKYALLLIQLERAGSESLKKIFQEEIKELRKQSGDLVNVVKHESILSDEDKATFYSNWYYSGIAVLCSLPSCDHSTALCERTGLAKQRLNQALKFLVSKGICTETKNQIKPGSKSTHLESSSPHISRHHGNWRLKAMEKHPNLDNEAELAYTSPMSLSKEDAQNIRNLIVDLIAQVNEIRVPSKCEEAYFLNIDWIKF
jgi:uncharacterized protein (TIGR02147 family)